ncbi:phosphotransferase family protein [Cellulosimicrobium cellulans]|uniref:phosphotransferase family protein n=1 Tax=Cellulosimicrobium cellulans TaxID=1710 RepID=UPI0037FDE21F
MAPSLGAPLFSGADADLYAVGADRVLRRSRSGADTVGTAEVMRHVRAAGFPAPRVDAATDGDLTMELLRGPTLLQSILGGRTSLAGSARILVALHDALHAVPPPAPDEPAYAALTAPSFATPDAPGAGAPCVLHLDLHPANVVLTADGPAVLHWTNARLGPAGLDLAVTAVVLAEVAADEDDELAPGARVLLDAFLHLADPVLLRHLDAAARTRAADPGLDPSEVALVPAAVALVAREARRS